MVETKFDPVRPPTIMQSEEELDDMEARIARGELPADFLDRHFEAVEGNVFGIDHKKDKKGNPIEQGIGAPGNQTKNSIEAYKKYGRPEKGASEVEHKEFADNLRRMQAELDACNEVRAASASARRRRGGQRKAS
jgi:hypothetical protein